jgi:hypothetical protein
VALKEWNERDKGPSSKRNVSGNPPAHVRVTPSGIRKAYVFTKVNVDDQVRERATLEGVLTIRESIGKGVEGYVLRSTYF